MACDCKDFQDSIVLWVQLPHFNEVVTYNIEHEVVDRLNATG